MTNSYPSGSPGVPEYSSMPTGASGGFVARRSSYASVVSGTAAAISQPYQQPTRSGAFANLLNQAPDFGYDSGYQNSGGQMRYDSRAYDMDFGVNGGQGGQHGRPASWGRNGHLPSFSSAYGPFMNGNGYGAYGTIHGDTFFVPSYLRGSKYVQKLEEGHKAKVLAHRDGPSNQSSQPGSLSTSASSTHIHAKNPPSHRGMTYDLIEKVPPVIDESLSLLPSKWNSQDKHSSLEVMSDGQEVKLTGSKTERERDLEAFAIRADHSMPSQCGIYYYEVTIVSRKREESTIAVGFSSKTVTLSRIPGWEADSWAYHGDDGNSYGCQANGKHYGPPFTAGDVIGCGVNFRTGSAFFTKNGDHLGTAFREVNKDKDGKERKLFPTVGMKKSGEHIRANFGQSPFVFDIDGMMSVSRDFVFSGYLPLGTTLSLPCPNNTPVYGEEPTDFEFRLLRQLIASWDGPLEVLRAIITKQGVPVSPAQAIALAKEHLFARRRLEKTHIQHEIERTSTERLAPPLNETDLIQSLVLQFLTHDGYVETARAFAEEVHSEKQALTLDPNAVLPGVNVKEDEDAGHRQRIRTAVLDGDVERALKYTNAFYPRVLKDNENVYFRLRCRRFIEMIRQGAELQHSNKSHVSKKSNGHNGDWYDDILNHDMDLDEQHPGPSNNWDRMETEESPRTNIDYDKLVQETLEYGQGLQAEFKDDPRREVSKALEDAFALMAYSDPLNAKEVAHQLDPNGRVAVAEELNAAILLSLGKSSSSALEQLYQQTSVLLEELREGGGPGAFVNIDDYARPNEQHHR
ncbi:hypothetical protein HYFRA_00008520 [Hymenoscyphus fraxineus]|uniref:Protein SSH4 n=1 Tax=Hymenoscyphus fraxineus TaxID=746836 RepID=A0A9N9KV35_9HELO|nr:hypothetical protein HYFRA_00008520 [Hymenoscyphus fraxineus]